MQLYFKILYIYLYQGNYNTSQIRLFQLSPLWLQPLLKLYLNLDMGFFFQEY